MAAAGEEDSTLPFVPQFIDWQDPGKINSIFHDGSSSEWSRIIIYRFSPRHRGGSSIRKSSSIFSLSHLHFAPLELLIFLHQKKFHLLKEKLFSYAMVKLPYKWTFLLLFLKGSLSSGHERQKGSLQIIGLKTTHFPFKVDGPLLLLEESSCTNANVLKVWQNIMA